MPDTGYMILNTGYKILDTEYLIQDTGYWILDTKYWIPNTWYRILDIWYWTGYWYRLQIPDTGYWIFDIGLDTGTGYRYRIQVTGYFILDWILIPATDTGYRLLDIRTLVHRCITKLNYIIFRVSVLMDLPISSIWNVSCNKYAMLNMCVLYLSMQLMMYIVFHAFCTITQYINLVLCYNNQRVTQNIFVYLRPYNFALGTNLIWTYFITNWYRCILMWI